jgi:indole-3-glycerol phosphate synthase
VQASKDWVPPGGTLGQILAETRERVASIERDFKRRGAGSVSQGLTAPAHPAAPRARLSAALRQPELTVVAEIKRLSPSKGMLNPGLNAAEQASRFERGGAAAISVLTEPTRFGGSQTDLLEVARVTELPLLRKDFHLSPLQLGDAAAGGASAVLLIARALHPDQLWEMMRFAAEMKLETVVEVRTEGELSLALELGAGIVGVNARDLESLEVDDNVPERLIPKIPNHVVAIWESGVSSRADVERAAAAGADAVLVGSALSLAEDPEALLASLTNVPRRRRG